MKNYGPKNDVDAESVSKTLHEYAVLSKLTRRVPGTGRFMPKEDLREILNTVPDPSLSFVQLLLEIPNLSDIIELIIPIDTYSETVQQYLVRKRPKLVLYIKNPSDSVIEVAIKRNPKLVHHIKTPSQKHIQAVIRFDPVQILFMRKLSIKSKLFALRQKNDILYKKMNACITHCDAEVMRNFLNTEELQLEFLKHARSRINASAFIRIFHPVSETVAIQLLSRAGGMYKKLKDHTESINMMAVSKSPSMIKYVVIPSETVKEIYFRRKILGEKHDDDPVIIKLKEKFNVI